MGVLKSIRELVNIGVTDSDDFYTVRLKQAVNVLTFNAVVCIIIAGIIGGFIKRQDHSAYLFLALPFNAVVFLLNLKGRVYTALTVLFSFSSVLLVLFSFRTGQESNTHFLFIPNIMGLAVLYKDSKMKLYYWLNFGFTMLCLAFVITGFHNGWFDFIKDQNTDPQGLRRMNLYFLVACSVVFSLVLMYTYSSHSRQIQRSLEEKEVLLAEINHRVKNNLTVVNSLLNLKMDASTSLETKESLRDVQSRIHSMAMVHQQMYETEGRQAICLKQYIEELVLALGNSFGVRAHFNMELEKVCLDVVDGIPFGMIMNELVTNSFKHAFKGHDVPEVCISLKTKEDGSTTLIYADNGPGMDVSSIDNAGSLGLGLISSLTEQINGNGHFSSENGFRYEMTF